LAELKNFYSTIPPILLFLDLHKLNHYNVYLVLCQEIYHAF
jgi:hypothetical protein